jgi:hypothetical protein
MTRATLALLSTLSFAHAAGCSGEPDTAQEQGSAVCGLTSYSESGRLVLEAVEANNYVFASTLTIDEVAVAPRSELTFDWSRVTSDFSGHAVDPRGDVDMVSLIVWKLSAQELAVKLNADDLSQSDFEAIAMIYTENALTEGELFELTSFGAEIDEAVLLDYLDPDILEPATHAYTVMAVTGKTPGKGTRMIHSFRLDEGSANTHIELHSDSASLEYEVDMSRLTPVTVPRGEADITIDWSGMMENSLGAEFDPMSITEVVVARYSMGVSELEARFLDIELIADELYRGEVDSGASFSLASATSESGDAFRGIDDSGTWLVGLMCGACTNPAPWFITVLQPCAAM